ncbi:type II toxin-antitoxin system PemK/MazF family toxin [Burkholderia glumae]|uniref:type II toxin-antitoxin system PemK/MazF family toxin n=1 Tax=Burkholderia glumae TaxID=337 RepID=UPI0005C2A2CA|nr:type II toxin-antitoxin system PemK/MazF family toxin [Burkholderia glumae]
MVNEVPEAGDIIWLSIGPKKGTEQDGFRPVLVMSDVDFNGLTGRVTGLPITSKVRGWETEIPVGSLKVPSVALSDQITTLDYRARGFKSHNERASENELAAARYAIRTILSL